MSTSANTTTGYYTDSLPEIANNSADLGVPAMSPDELVEMFAHAMKIEAIFERAKDQLTELHFNGMAEEPFAETWMTYLRLAETSGTMPSVEALRSEIQREIAESERVNPGRGHLGLNEAMGEGGLIDRLAQRWPLESLSEVQGKLLIKKFLHERDVISPFKEIVGRATWDGQPGECVPANFDRLLRRAAERQEEIERDWGNAEPWGEPEPLSGPELPQFPLDVLPPTLRDWVEAEATATQTPPDLAAMLGLAVCSAATAKRVDVWVKAGWVEPVNLYVVCVLESGNRKSAVFTDATVPLREHEREAIENLAPQVRAYETRAKVLKARRDNLEKRAARTSNSNDCRDLIAQATAAGEELATLCCVAKPKLLVDDCTPEKLEIILAEQAGRIAIMSPEGGIFNMMKGRYSGVPQFDVFLKGHAGDEIRTDRVGREPVFITKPAITMALAVQPEVIRGLGEKAELRGQGLLARILYTLPRSLLGNRVPNPPPVQEVVSAAYHRVVSELCRMARIGVSSSGLETRHLMLATEAEIYLNDFMARLEPRLSQWGELAGVQDWAGKLAGAVVRLAAILHLIEQVEARECELEGERREQLRQRQRPNQFAPWEVCISERTLSVAVAIAEYLVPHTQVAFDMMGMATGPGSAVVANAWHAMAWIRQHARTRFTFTKRDLHQENRSRFTRAADVDPVLELLVCRNIIRTVGEPSGGPRSGRKPSGRYDVNPRLLELEFAGPPRAGV